MNAGVVDVLHRITNLLFVGSDKNEETQKDADERHIVHAGTRPYTHVTQMVSIMISPGANFQIKDQGKIYTLTGINLYAGRESIVAICLFDNDWLECFVTETGSIFTPYRLETMPPMHMNTLIVKQLFNAYAGFPRKIETFSVNQDKTEVTLKICFTPPQDWNASAVHSIQMRLQIYNKP